MTPISLGTFFGSEIGKYPATYLGDCEFILHIDRAGILANPCNPCAKLQRDQAAQVDVFYWDDPYPIALELLRRHPGVDPLSVSWETLHRWVVELPQFADDASVTSLNLLEDIQKEWYEEVTSR